LWERHLAAILKQVAGFIAAGRRSHNSNKPCLNAISPNAAKIEGQKKELKRC
jgi:hypothetical protein